MCTSCMGLPDDSVETYRDLVYYQYARLIAEAAGVEHEGFMEEILEFEER